MDFPSDIAVKNSPANAGDADWALGLRRSPGGGNVNPFQYSCLENLMDRGGWWAIYSSWGLKGSDTISN